MINPDEIIKYCKQITAKSFEEGPADYLWQHGLTDYDTAILLKHRCDGFMWSRDPQGTLWMRGPITDRRLTLLRAIKDLLDRGQVPSLGEWIFKRKVMFGPETFHTFDLLLVDVGTGRALACIELSILANDDPETTVQALRDTCNYTNCPMALCFRVEMTGKLDYELTVYSVVSGCNGPVVSEYRYPPKKCTEPTHLQIRFLHFDMGDLHSLLLQSFRTTRLPH